MRNIIMKKIVSLLLSVCMAMSVVFCLSACGKESLQSPQNLHVGNKILRWEEVENATEYVIKVDNIEYTTENNYYPLSFFEKTGKYVIQVKAKGDGYEDSDWKDITYRFEAEVTPNPDHEPEPTLPTSKGGLKFTLLEDGSGYEVKKLPWIPKFGEEYWCVIPQSEPEYPKTALVTMNNSVWSLINLIHHNYFQTQDKAEAHKIDFVKKLQAIVENGVDK